MFVAGSFIKPLRTFSLYKRLKNGDNSKLKEWGAIEGVPCLVKSVSEEFFLSMKRIQKKFTVFQLKLLVKGILN